MAYITGQDLTYVTSRHHKKNGVVTHSLQFLRPTDDGIEVVESFGTDHAALMRRLRSIGLVPLINQTEMHNEINRRREQGVCQNSVNWWAE